MNDKRLRVSPQILQDDKDQNIQYLSEENPKDKQELDDCEVIVDEKGIFRWKHLIQYPEVDSRVDTKAMTAHSKNGYAGYVVREDGRMFIFHHLGGQRGIVHSSFSQGQPVIAAGELKMTEGGLVRINTHSGHYKPSLLHVKRILEIFQLKRVDISKTEVETVTDPATHPELGLTGVMRNFSEDQKEISSHIRRTDDSNAARRYYTSAKALCVSLADRDDEKTKKAIAEFDKQENSKLTALFKWLEPKKKSGSKEQSLTHARCELRTQFKSRLQLDIKNMGIDQKIEAIEAVMSQNSALSQQHQKSATSGRFHTELSKYKDALVKLKDRQENPFNLDLEDDRSKSETKKLKQIF